MSRWQSDVGSPVRISCANDERVHEMKVVAVEGEERINALFDYRVTLQTPLVPEGMARPEVDIAPWCGQQFTLDLDLDGQGTFEAGAAGWSGQAGQGSGRRQITGIVSQAAVLDRDSWRTTVQLTLRPWLFRATLASNCRIFQDLDVVQIIDELLGDYVWPLEKRLTARYPPRDFCLQYNETDYEFFSRLCQEWGINHHFEHCDGRHTLVLSDDNSAFRRFQPDRTAVGDQSPYHEIPIHPPGHRIDREYVYAFVPGIALTSATWRASDYDYMRPGALMLAQGGLHQGPHRRAQLEVYTWRGDRPVTGGADWAQPDAGAHPLDTSGDQPRLLAGIRMQAIEQHAHRAEGAGHIRGIVPGCRFRLREHAVEAANRDYIVVAARLRLQSPGQAAQSADTGRSWSVHTEFVAQDFDALLRPDSTQPKPRIHGLEPALVTGPEGHDLHTDSMHRIKVRFFWDRSGRADASSSCWLRVVTPWAGNQLGMTFVPRVGQEVAVAFFGGDPDLPIVIGSVHNGNNHPAWRLPAHSGLSGIRTRELGDRRGNGALGRSNHLAFDDTSGSIQVQVKSDHLHSMLSSGQVTRIEDHDGRKDARGQGFELRTDGVGALRTGRGLLLSTDSRERAVSHIQDTREVAHRLDAAKDLQQSLARVAQEHSAQDPKADQEAIAEKLSGHNDEIAGRPGEPEAFGQLATPHLVLSSATSLAASAASEIQLAAGGDVATTSGGHTGISAGASFFATARDAIRMFARRCGVRIFAAEGPVQLQAQDDRIELIARKALELISTTDWLHLRAKEGIALGVGETTLHITGGGFAFRTRGTHHVWAGDHQTFGPQSLANTLPPLPHSVCVPCLLKAARSASPLSSL